MRRRDALGVLLALAGTAAAATAAAGTLAEALASTSVSGHLRLYDFTRRHDGNGPLDTGALALGGNVLVHTGEAAGFSAGLDATAVTSLGGYAHVNEVLVGPRHHLAAVDQAFLQFRSRSVLARVGRQVIHTPWAGPDLFTMLPRAFSGVAVTVEAVPGDLSFFAARMNRYESRFDDRFTAGNRYTAARTRGFLALGTRLGRDDPSRTVHAQAWYYDFYDFARLAYAEARYRSPGPGVRLLAGVQAVHETGSGSERLGPVDCTIAGALVGIESRGARVWLVFDGSPVRDGSFRHGGLVHPYNDLSGTLYTDTMNNGISDIGPGTAVGVKAAVHGPRSPVAFSAAYVRYRARFGYGGAAYATEGQDGFPPGMPVRDQRQWAFDAGVSYRFGGRLSGLRIFDFAGLRDFAGSPRGAFIDNRLGAVYSFSSGGVADR